MKSWQTTVAGVSAILVAVGAAVGLMLDGDPLTNPAWGVTVAAVMVGVGMIFARTDAQHKKDG
jgi:ABC-type Mn2+/Zn2+ transport system permease subunit